ncbi:hypothetical protein O2W18_00360 [Modestobacter sp. VKM Ac-2983]|uniref:hypothetical protein n=1 Tax=Modestobacter sp. VKM Ac-2983 TaxID=3004137 RepID=UPI0022AB8AEA|nr:hypothetical protein [Modestobacter sp. VKM Ac-2983]MCZ2803552.1 hypothetical protein [Modestobacter sp. VKM Ac-2983]
MNPHERDLAGRLHGLADELTAGGGGDAADAVARWRHRRRTRRTLTAVAVGVAAVAVGGVVAVGPPSSAPLPGGTARPTVTSSAPATAPTPPPPGESTPSGTPVPDDSPVTGGATEAYGKEPIPAVSAAEKARLTAEAQADLDRVVDALPPSLAFPSPTEWDRWLPEPKPYPGRDTADDLSTCPVLSDGLSAALGSRMSYWTGTLPGACTWAPVPLLYDTIDYPFTVRVGFLGDGTTPADVARDAFDWVPQGDPTPCPRADVVDGGVLIRCSSVDQASFQLAVPDARGKGTWVLDATADQDGEVTAAEAFTALLDGVARNYG